MKISQYKTILYSSLILTLFYNISFFKNFFLVYNFSKFNIIYTFSVALTLFLLIYLILLLFSSKYTLKPFLILIFIISSFSAYFMDTYNIVIDKDMIRNILETNFEESYDLLSYKLLLYVIILGLLPSYFIYKIKITYNTFIKELLKKIVILFLILIIILLNIFAFSEFYISFFRQHKILRYYSNPTAWIYSSINYTIKNFFVKKRKCYKFI